MSLPETDSRGIPLGIRTGSKELFGRLQTMKLETRRKLYVAPHLDDGAISLGGTLLADGEKDTSKIQTVVATVFSRSNYTKKGLSDAAKVTPIRQAEEKEVMGSVGVATVFMGFGECPLRGYTISDPLDYPKLIKPELEAGVVEAIAESLDKLFKDFDEVAIPLAVGEGAHVDHRIVRKAATMSQRNNPDVIFGVYEDIPYISREDRDRIGVLGGFGLEETGIDLEAKLDLIRGYRSQPIEAWEDMIRQAAGRPPVERKWSITESGVLERLR
jgi:LmbE family N-acetylglucosaminyl deacetylase